MGNINVFGSWEIFNIGELVKPIRGTYPLLMANLKIFRISLDDVAMPEVDFIFNVAMTSECVE